MITAQIICWLLKGGIKALAQHCMCARTELPSRQEGAPSKTTGFPVRTIMVFFLFCFVLGFRLSQTPRFEKLLRASWLYKCRKARSYPQQRAHPATLLSSGFVQFRPSRRRKETGSAQHHRREEEPGLMPLSWQLGSLAHAQHGGSARAEPPPAPKGTRCQASSACSWLCSVEAEGLFCLQ